MNYLQIWIGETPNDVILSNMNSIINNLKENDTYTLISDKLKFENNRVNHIDYLEFVEKMNCDALIKKFWDFIPNNKIYHSIRSDVIRYYYLSINTDILYLDCDIKLNSISSFNYLIGFPSHGIDNSMVENYIIYGNDTKFFKKIIECSINNFFSSINPKLIERTKELINKESFLQILNVDYYMWTFITCNGRYFKDQITIIDNIDFEHNIK